MAQALRIEPTSTTVTVAGTQHPVLEIALGGVPRGLVLLLCDDGGLARDAVEMQNDLAQHGYESLAVEVAAEADPAQPEAVVDTVQALLARAQERGWTADQTAVLGVGLGGRAALAAAAGFELAAAISVSPTVDVGYARELRLHEAVASVRTPWLGMFGASDAAAPADDVRTLGRQLDQESDVFTQVVRYPQVGRDFYRNTSSDGVSYAASYDGWQRVFEWLDARVAPRLTPLAEQWRRRHGDGQQR